MSSYKNLISYLFSLTRQGIKLGLQSMEQLDSALGNPSRAFQSIHVAGTNGKGSVTTKVAQCLQLANRKVGRYTSPHIATFRERIAINSCYISENEVEHFLPQVMSAAQSCDLSPTFFEITTALAFLYFAKKDVEIAVIETGMGGRFDATNIIYPITSVITSIDWDHQQYLGDTLEKIAYEKSGIIKEKTNVVVSSQVADFEVFAQTAAAKQCQFFIAQAHPDNYEDQNQATAKMALKSIGFNDSYAIAEGILVRPPCRYEVINRSKPIILDVGHNPEGLKALFKRVKKDYGEFDVLFGLSADKDLVGCVQILSQAKQLYVTQAASLRAAPIEEIAKVLNDLEVHHFVMHKKIETALSEALKCSPTSRPLVICGSFFIMSEVRACLGFQDQQDALPLTEAVSVKKLS